MEPEPDYERGLGLHRSGDLDGAAACYRAVLASEPTHFGALHLLGVIEGQRGRYAEAAALIEQAIDVDAHVAAAHANLGHARQALGDLLEALISYQRALALQPTHRIALMGKARTCRLLGRLTDALSGYEAALDLEPDCTESLMNRGDILLALERTADGVASLRRAAACGADAERIAFVLGAIGEDVVPPVAPPGYLKDLFDGYADRFDAELVEGLNYRVPQLLATLVTRNSSRAAIDILDLGCGTGLCGPQLQPVARRLTGVDLSPGMLEKARARDVYTELACMELTDYLASRGGEEFDLVVAGDVLIYFGDLAPVFAGVRRALRSGGLFAFSVEAAEGPEWELPATRRYRHAQSYLERLAVEHRFEVVVIERAVVRSEVSKGIWRKPERPLGEGTDVHGYLALLRAG